MKIQRLTSIQNTNFRTFQTKQKQNAKVNFVEKSSSLQFYIPNYISFRAKDTHIVDNNMFQFLSDYKIGGVKRFDDEDIKSLKKEGTEFVISNACHTMESSSSEELAEKYLEEVRAFAIMKDENNKFRFNGSDISGLIRAKLEYPKSFSLFFEAKDKNGAYRFNGEQIKALAKAHAKKPDEIQFLAFAEYRDGSYRYNSQDSNDICNIERWAIKAKLEKIANIENDSEYRFNSGEIVDLEALFPIFLVKCGYNGKNHWDRFDEYVELIKSQANLKDENGEYLTTKKIFDLITKGPYRA